MKAEVGMQAQSGMKLEENVAVNSFLLCSVLAKQARRLGKLLPDRRVAELIRLAWKNYADYEIRLELGCDVPQIIRAEAMQIARLTRRSEPALAPIPAEVERSKVADVISVIQHDEREAEHPDKASNPGNRANGSHVSMDGAINSRDSHCNLSSLQRTLLMSRSNAIDPTRLRQLRAITDNLCTLANRHRENKNYVVAHALYGRALAVAQDIHTPDDDGSSLVARIRKDQETVFDLMRSGDAPEKPPLETAKEVGR